MSCPIYRVHIFHWLSEHALTASITKRMPEGPCVVLAEVTAHRLDIRPVTEGALVALLRDQLSEQRMQGRRYASQFLRQGRARAAAGCFLLAGYCARNRSGLGEQARAARGLRAVARDRGAVRVMTRETPEWFASELQGLNHLFGLGLLTREEYIAERAELARAALREQDEIDMRDAGRL